MQTHAHTFCTVFINVKTFKADFTRISGTFFLHLNKTNKHSLELRTYLIHTLVKPLK